MKIRTAVVGLVLVGCGGVKAPPDDDLSTLDGKSDSWDTRTKYVGALDGGPDAAPATIAYTHTPRYRSAGFHATGGEYVDLWVRSPDGSGDAVAYLLDFQHKVIAKNDDADASTVDAHIHVDALPPSNGSYTVFFRDYYGHHAKFSISLDTGIPSGPVGDAESAYDDAVPTLDSFSVARTKLPATPRARYDHFVTKWGAANAYKLNAAGKVVYGVSAGAEEIYWVDLYDSSGKLIIHGFGGDGGPDITAWGPPASYDPSDQ